MIIAEARGLAINVREQATEDDLPHRRVVMPGYLVNGEWHDTDMSMEPNAVLDEALKAWTPEGIAAYREDLEEMFRKEQRRAEEQVKNAIPLGAEYLPLMDAMVAEGALTATRRDKIMARLTKG